MTDTTPPTEPTDSTEPAEPPAPGAHAASAPAGRRRARSRRGVRRGVGVPAPVKRHPVISVVTSSLLVVALLTATAVTLVYNSIDHGIQVLQVAKDGKDPNRITFPDAPHQPLNILIMGSDTRDCKGCHIDNQSGGGSDTTLLLHLSRDRQHAYGVSVPRDLIYDRPECKNTKGEVFPAEADAQWNAAYSVAGPGCTITQFQHMTHIAIDDYVVVNFAGFKDMVDAVGGVKVCVPQEIDDQAHGIVIKAGTRTIDGDQALSYVRERHGVGDGSDLGRIKRQQAFIASMVQAVLSAKTLANPFRVYKFLKAATSALQVDEKLGNLKDLASLAYGFKDIGLSKIKFFTMPIATDPADPNRVIPASTAPELWKALKHDRNVSGDLVSGVIKPSDVPGSKKSRKQGKNPKNSSKTEQLAAAGLCT